MGLLGQNIVNDSNQVFVTKTHYPIAHTNCKPFTAEKMIVIARNPIDVIPSFANLVNTNSHSLEVNQRYNVDEPEFWDAWVADMIDDLKMNHEQVTNGIASKLPTFYMRYEDLKTNPEPVLMDLFCFLLNVESLEGTLCA